MKTRSLDISMQQLKYILAGHGERVFQINLESKQKLIIYSCVLSATAE